MFFAQNEYGSNVLADVFHTLPIESHKRLKVVAKFLDVTESTLKKWLTGKSNPPRAVVYALWHESHMGRAVTSAHSEEGARINRRLANSLQDEIDKLRRTVDALNDELNALKKDASTPQAMNEPRFKRY